MKVPVPGPSALSDMRLPDGFEVVIDKYARYLGEDVIVGGWPTRLVRLSPAAKDMIENCRLVVEGSRRAQVARRLLDAGIVQPRPRGTTHSEADVTVVVPVRARTAMLRRLLESLSGGPPVIVVDDGSADWEENARVAYEGGARFMRHMSCRGPGAARNTALRVIETPLVAFIDSDCVAPPGWLSPLLAHFDDPVVALVAPRIVALPVPKGGFGHLAKYEAARSSLDLGPTEALVGSRGRVPWVPSAALVARRGALGTGFAEDILVGEDVDLVWRLQNAGWHIRYEPSCVVWHEHRSSYRTWAMRKVHYGTSAAVLGKRHGHQVAPVVLAPWAAATWSLLLFQRKGTSALAAVILSVTGGALVRRLPPARRRYRVATHLLARGFAASGLQVASALVRAWWPLTVLASALCRPARRALLVAGTVDAVADWARHRPRMGPFSYMLFRRADDLAYGTGLWWGAVRQKSLEPLLPDLGDRARTLWRRPRLRLLSSPTRSTRTG